jgi:hypothetical protein
MADSIPSVLCRLARDGVSVQWRDGKAVFKATAEPPANIVALIDARKADVSAFLHPDAVQRRLDAEADPLLAPCPADLDASDIHIDDDVEIRVHVRWKAALRGLRAFLANGYGDEAERLGWPRNELYAVPPVWARVDLCGAALLVGDCEVVEVTAKAIRIRTASGAIQAFYRRPEIDYGLVFSERRRLLVRDVDEDEAWCRAFEHTVAFCRSHTGLDLESAKNMVLSAINTGPRLAIQPYLTTTLVEAVK